MMFQPGSLTLLCNLIQGEKERERDTERVKEERSKIRRERVRGVEEREERSKGGGK